VIAGFDMWLEFGLAAAIVLAGLTAIVAKRFAARHNERVVDKVRQGESVRLMALAYQAQGKLDAAFQKFQEAPRPHILIDDLYNLAVDYEKAGDSKNVVAVLKLVQERMADYRGTEQMLARARERLVRAKAASVTQPAAAPSGRARFGAFEVHGELGKGAIGVVYRGVDATLGREVAIKTLRSPANSKARRWKERAAFSSTSCAAPARCRTPTSSPSTTPARSAACATWRWNSCRGTTSPRSSRPTG
jgi:eukaryotic-like serine/threonine-protein kinase